MSNHSASPLEPSMEDILASIRRIIAEEDEQEARSAGRRPPPEPVHEETVQPETARASRPEVKIEPQPDELRREIRTEIRTEVRREARPSRFGEPPAEPAKVDWSGLGAESPAPPPPPAPPAPSREPEVRSARREADFDWLDERSHRQEAEDRSPREPAEARFDFELPFGDSGDSDLESDLGAILKPSAAQFEELAAPAPRVVESAYGGRFVEEPTPAQPSPPPRPAPPPADPFARFLTPPPSAFDDGYTLDPNAEPIAIESTAAAAKRQAEEEAEAIGRASSGLFADLGSAARGARSAVGEAASEADEFFGDFGRSAAKATDEAAKDVFGGLGDLGRSAAKTAGEASRDVFGGFGDLGRSAVKATDEAAKDVFGGLEDLGRSAVKATDEAAKDVFGGLGDLGRSAVKAAAEAPKDVFGGLEDLGRSAVKATDEAAKDVFGGLGDLGRSAVKTAGEAGKSAAESAAGALEDLGDLGRSAVKATGDAGRSVAKTANDAFEAILPEAPEFEAPKLDLPDFGSLREEAVRKTDSARAEIADAFSAVKETAAKAPEFKTPEFKIPEFGIPEPKAQEQAFGGGASEKETLRDAFDVFGGDRFGREDLDDSVLNLTNDRRIPEAPPARDSAADANPFSSDSFWDDEPEEKPARAAASVLDIPPTPAQTGSGLVREELLLTERAEEPEEDPISAWDSTADAAKIAAAVAAQAAARPSSSATISSPTLSSSTALTAPPRPQEGAASLPAAPSRPRLNLDEDEELLSEAAERASARAMAALSAAVSPKPRLHGQLRLLDEDGDGETLNALVRQMLKPMLREWLDENLPAMVERLVRSEVERVSARAAWSEDEED